MTLKERFYHIATQWFKDKALLEQYWNELSENYSETFRKYHNSNHLLELFKYYDTYCEELKQPKEVAFAIFYHDIIYNIWSNKNELKSAKLAQKYLKATKLDDSAINRIFNLILVTKNHEPKDNVDEKWMVDFDIAILGQPWEDYLQYTKHIREEYASVPKLMYKQGRRKVLVHFLNKERIYQTEIFFKLYELEARNNLNKELEIL